MKNNKQQFTFPKNTSDLITKLTQKHGIEESSDEMLNKFTKGEKIQGEKILNILKETQNGTLSKSNLSVELQKRLGISKTKATNLKKDILNVFFTLKQKKITNKITRETTKPKQKKEASNDTYREPLS